MPNLNCKKIGTVIVIIFFNFLSIISYAAFTPALTGSDSENIIPANFPYVPRTRQNLVYPAGNTQPPYYNVTCPAGTVGVGANRDTFNESFRYTYDERDDDPWYTYLIGRENSEDYRDHPDMNGIRCFTLNSTLNWCSIDAQGRLTCT